MALAMVLALAFALALILRLSPSLTPYRIPIPPCLVSLRSEIAVLKLVNHPNIVRMMGVFESRLHIYIVLELLEGGALRPHCRPTALYGV